MFEFIKKDYDRYFKIAAGQKQTIPLKRRIKLLVYSYGLHATCVYRFGQFIHSHDFPLVLLPIKYVGNIFYFLMSYIVKKAYGIHINRKTVIGQGFYIGHYGGIYIGEECSCIGENCSIQQRVCIGEQTKTDPISEIKIGNRVWIGAHAKINGDVVIEDNVTVAAGAVIRGTKVVNQKNLVAGNPARTVKKNFDNSFLL